MVKTGRLLRVTVCQLNNDPAGLAEDWAQLVNHVQVEGSELVVLPEMPFYPWPCWSRQFDPAGWEASVKAHSTWLSRVAELLPAAVVATRPISNKEGRFNEGFIMENQVYRPIHHKFYLPDDPGFWEASWYQRGMGDFVPGRWPKANFGFLICTELWFMHHARNYGKAGVQLLLTPRATEKRTLDKWLAGGRAAAVISGAYSLSSNLVSQSDRPVSLGGQGWLIDPDGNVLALTSAAQPFVTCPIDLTLADEAKQNYPRYVLD